LHPPRLQKALEILDTDKSGEVDADEWRVARRPLHVVRSPSTPSTHYARREEAINRGLSKRLEQLAAEQERRAKAAAAADEEFSVEFLNAARAVFRMIDADGSGTLEKAEVVDAVKNNQKVIKFLETCGNPNLQYLLVPERLEAALRQLDTDRDGHIDESEWEECIEVALSAKLEQREAKREAQAKAAAKEVAAFTLDFKNAARRCFELIDKDEGGTLDKGEIVRAVKEDAEVISFLETCGEENLQFLLVPDRLEASLDALDTSKDGELDIDECIVAASES
jgi:Ca2+-binding EF-hand superfamily protein